MTGARQDGQMEPDRPAPELFDVERASVFDVYDELLVPLCFQGYADDLASRVDDLREGAVLVVGCGTGADTRALVDRLPPTVAVTAIDIVPGMVERAQRRGTSRPVTWDVADAQSLPYDDGSFDLVVCQFGAMFFPDKVTAFAEAARVLRPAGRFELALWDRIETNDFADAVAVALRAQFPDDPPAFLERMPYSYHEPDVIVADLVAGGFTAPDAIERIERVGRVDAAGSPEVVAGAFCAGTPVRDQLQSGGADRLALAITGTSRALAERFGPSDLTGRSSAIVASARKA
jgi:SAM-dependent methyltransferase